MRRILGCLFSGLFLLISFSCSIYPVGSELAVSIESHVDFPVLLDTDDMVGFAWFKNGYSMDDDTVAVDFSSVFPISGLVQSRGTLTLFADLVFHNVTTLNNLKAVVGNGHKIELCSSITNLPADASSFSNLRFVLNDDLVINSAITFSGDCEIIGRGNKVTLAAGASITVAAGATLSLEELSLDGITGTNVSCVDDTGTLVLDNVRWIQDGNFTFASGGITFTNCVRFSGPYTFSYTTGVASTVSADSMWRIGNNMVLEIGRKLASGYVEPLAFADDTSILHMEDCVLSVTANGMGVTKGELVFDGDVTVTVASTGTNNGLTIGDGTASGDCIARFLPSASIKHVIGHITYNNSVNNLLKSTSKHVRLIRSENSFIHVAQSLKLPAVTIVIESVLVPPMSIAAGKTLEYDGSFVVLPDVEFDISSNQLDALTYLLNGNDSIFFSKGELPLGLSIQGTGNKVSGNGSAQGPVVLQDSSAELTFDITGELLGNMTMNGGKLILGGHLTFGPGVVLSDDGVVDLSSYQLSLGAQDITWPSAINWTCNSSEISLHSTALLNNSWTITGSCTINGNGNVLDLSGGGELIVAAGGSLTIKDVRLRGVSSTNVRCLGADSKLILRDMVWLQDADVTFGEGSLEFNGTVVFSGPYTFSYTTGETSTIKSKSKWRITDGLTLSIGRKMPPSIYSATVEPLEFENSTSVVKLDKANLYVTANGLGLTKGLAEFGRLVNINMEATGFDTGVTVGDGVLANDFHLQFNAGATVQYATGYFTLKNSANDTLQSAAHKNGLWIRDVGAHVLIDQDLVMPEVSVEVASNLVPPMQLGAGKTLSYDNTHVVLPDVAFDIKGTQYDPFTYLLDGNDFIFFGKGSLPLNVMVQGADNVIKGNGSMSGALSLQDGSSSLACGISGDIVNSVVMNGGTMTLNRKLRLGTGALFTGPGTVDLQGYNLSLGSADLTWTTPITWSGSGGTIHLNADITLSNTWTCTGAVTIEGHGHTINLAGSGELVAAAGATLNIKGAELQNINGNNVRCDDSAGMLVLDDVVWVQSADAVFADGVLNFKNLVGFIGDGSTLTYQTNQTSTVHSRSTIKLYPGFTLSYEPSAGASKDLLTFTDETSWLVLDGATLRADETGLNLTKGKIKVKGNSAFSSGVVLVDDEIVTDEGITLGDGVAGGNDFCVEVVNGAVLEVREGSLQYKNLNADSWTMSSNHSTLCIAGDVELHLHESLDLGVGFLHLQEGASMLIEDGKALIGSIIHVI